ncbi:hypothetical protein AB0C81_36060 [Streptomyces roseoverticillatus]
MHWSWEQRQATPVYVRRYCLDNLGVLAEHEQRESERERRRAESRTG